MPKIYHEEVKRPAASYAWLIVAACFAVSLTLGEAFSSFGIFFKPLQGDFGWSRTTVSSGYTALLIGYSISTVVAGRLADRYSPRPILLATAVFSGLGIALCSQVQNINEFRAFNFIAGLGAGATWSVPSSTVQRWFYGKRRAGLAVAIVLSGIGVGGLIFAPLISQLILSYGWRNTYLIIGILFFVIIAVSAFVIKRYPAEESASEKGTVASNSPMANGWTIRNIVRTRAFLGISFLNGASLITWHVMSAHLVPHATDIGIAPMVAAAAFGLIGGMTIAGRLLSGLMSEKLAWQRITAIAFYGMAASMPWVLFMRNVWTLYGFVFSYGLYYGLRTPAHIGILSEFFGMRYLGEIIGVTAAIGQLMGAFGPFIAGFIFDRTGSYTIAFLIVLGILLSAGAIATALKKPTTTAQSGKSNVGIAGQPARQKSKAEE